MKKIIIEKQIFNMFPSTQIGVIVVKNIENKGKEKEIDLLLRESEKWVLDNFEGKTILELPEMKTWRETYKAFGAKKGRRVSIEAMIKRVLKGDKIPSINPLVDIYNSCSLKHVFPCGGEDLDRISGDLKLTVALGNEEFRTIGSEENDPPNVGEVVYKDEAGCVCRCWNWREADRTKLTGDTKNAILVIESLEKERRDDFLKALDNLGALTKQLLGGTIDSYVLDVEKNEVEI